MDEIIVTTPEKLKQIVETCFKDFLNKNTNAVVSVENSEHIDPLKTE